MRNTYTKEMLEPLVENSFSYAELMRKCGLRSGCSHASTVRRIKEFDLDVSHFLGQARNCGVKHTGGTPKLHWSAILVFHRLRTRKEHTDLLRNAMIDSGIEYRCGVCDCLPLWMGSVLVLHIHHKNGDNQDNRKENLRFDCPNCHSQSENYGAKNIGKIFARLVELPDTTDLESVAG